MFGGYNLMCHCRRRRKAGRVGDRVRFAGSRLVGLILGWFMRGGLNLLIDKYDI